MADEQTQLEAAVVRPFSIRTLPGSLIAVALVGAALKGAAPLLIPLLISLLLAYTLEPAVALLTRVRVPRPIAAVIVFGVVLTAVRAGGAVILHRADTFAQDLPETAAAIGQEIAAYRERRGPGMLDRLRKATAEVQRTTDTRPAPTETVRVVKEPVQVTSLVFTNGVTATAAAGRTFAIAVLTFLLMATGDLYKRKLLKLAGPRAEARRITSDVIRNIDRQIERYVAVRLLISTIVAVFTALVLWPIGLRHWVSWGIVAGVLNVLPFIGPSASVGMIGLAAFLQFRSAGAVAASVVLSGLVAMLEGNFLTPWLTSRAGELNTVAVFVDVLLWGWMWGMWGLLLAVPILVVVKAAADHIEPLQPLAELLGR